MRVSPRRSALSGLRKLIYKAEEGGYGAEVSALSGCFSQDETIEEEIKVNIGLRIE